MVFREAADVSLNNVYGHGLQNRAIRDVYISELSGLLYPSHRVDIFLTKIQFFNCFVCLR